MTQSGAHIDFDALIRLTAPTPGAPDAAVNWPSLIRLAKAHGVVLQLARGVATTGVKPPPDGGAASALQALVRRRTRNALGQVAAITDALSALADAGCDGAICKGVGLSLALFGDVGRRDPGDIDILVSPGRLAAADRALCGLGYDCRHSGLLDRSSTRRRLLANANQLAYRGPGGAIDLHWRWRRFDWMMPTEPARVRGGPSFLLGGAQIPTPDPVDHFLYLCAHGVGHEWRMLKWLNDLRHILARPDCLGAEWEQVATRARAVSMTLPVALAALQVLAIDGAPPPAPVQALINETPAARAMAGPMRRKMLVDGPNPHAHRRTRLGAAMRYARLSHRMAGQGRPSAAYALLAHLLSPQADDLMRVDLPTGLGWLYAPLRVIQITDHPTPT